MVDCILKDFKESLRDNLFEIEENYNKALDLIIDLVDERDYANDRLEEVIRLLRYVEDADLNEMTNTIREIIEDYSK